MTNQTIKKDPNNRGEEELKERLRSLWLGRRDSNPRMSAPKTDALPLGHAPSSELMFCTCLLAGQQSFV